MATNEDVELHYTMTDRDLARDTHKLVGELVRDFRDFQSRLVQLENMREQGKGVAWMVRGLFAAVVGLFTIVGVLASMFAEHVKTGR